MTKDTARSLALLGPVLAFCLVFLALPYAVLLRLSFYRYSALRLYVPEFTWANYAAVMTDSFYLGLVGRTVLLGVGVSAATLVLGYPLALTVARAGPRLRVALLVAALSPLLVNLVVRSYAWLVLLGDAGLVNRGLLAAGVIAGPLPLGGNLFSVTVGLVHIGLPLMVLSLLAVIERIDPALMEAAGSLGAPPGRVVRRITLPLSWPGIGAGSLLVFCFTISAFVTPAMLGGNRVATVSTMVADKFTVSLNWPVGATLVVLLLALTLAWVDTTLGVPAQTAFAQSLYSPTNRECVLPPELAAKLIAGPRVDTLLEAPWAVLLPQRDAVLDRWNREFGL